MSNGHVRYGAATPCLGAYVTEPSGCSTGLSIMIYFPDIVSSCIGGISLSLTMVLSGELLDSLQLWLLHGQWITTLTQQYNFGMWCSSLYSCSMYPLCPWGVNQATSCAHIMCLYCSVSIIMLSHAAANHYSVIPHTKTVHGDHGR